MTIRAIIFDLGGVLVRTEQPSPREALAKKLGRTRQQLEALVFSEESGMQAQRGEIDVQDHWAYVAGELGIPEAEIPGLQDQFWGGDQLDEDLVNAIRGYKQDYTTALLSNAFNDLRWAVEEVWEIEDAFDEIFISAELGIVKPDPRIFQLVLERLGAAPEEAVFIDDFETNVEGARSVGLHAIHFRSTAQALQELEELLTRDGTEG